MTVKLPLVVKNEISQGKRIFKTEERDFEIDMSLGCQMRWEATFPELAAKESFVDYAARTKEMQSKNAAVILAKMKAVYCFFDTELSFTGFIKMFDFSQPEFTNALIERLNEVFEIVLNSSAEKN